MSTVSPQWLSSLRATQMSEYPSYFGLGKRQERTEDYFEVQRLKHDMEMHKREMAEKEAALKAETEDLRLMMRDFMMMSQMSEGPSVLDSLPAPPPFKKEEDIPTTTTSVSEPSSA